LTSRAAHGSRSKSHGTSLADYLPDAAAFHAESLAWPEFLLTFDNSRSDAFAFLQARIHGAIDALPGHRSLKAPKLQEWIVPQIEGGHAILAPPVVTPDERIWIGISSEGAHAKLIAFSTDGKSHELGPSVESRETSAGRPERGTPKNESKERIGTSERITSMALSMDENALFTCVTDGDQSTVFRVDVKSATADNVGTVAGEVALLAQTTSDELMAIGKNTHVDRIDLTTGKVSAFGRLDERGEIAGPIIESPTGKLWVPCTGRNLSPNENSDGAWTLVLVELPIADALKASRKNAVTSVDLIPRPGAPARKRRVIGCLRLHADALSLDPPTVRSEPEVDAQSAAGKMLRDENEPANQAWLVATDDAALYRLETAEASSEVAYVTRVKAPFDARALCALPAGNGQVALLLVDEGNAGTAYWCYLSPRSEKSEMRVVAAEPLRGLPELALQAATSSGRVLLAGSFRRGPLELPFRLREALHLAGVSEERLKQLQDSAQRDRQPLLFELVRESD
jgi:hypothetical protein